MTDKVMAFKLRVAPDRTALRENGDKSVPRKPIPDIQPIYRRKSTFSV